jgi:hypothetical protein
LWFCNSFLCNYFNNINKKQFQCKCYNVVGLISKTMKLLEIQTMHRHYMGLLCTFELLSNTNIGKFKFKFKLKPIGTIKMCCLLLECSNCKTKKRCDKLQIYKWYFFISQTLENQPSSTLGLMEWTRKGWAKSKKTTDKKWSSPTLVVISNVFGIFVSYPKNDPHKK